MDSDLSSGVSENTFLCVCFQPGELLYAVYTLPLAQGVYCPLQPKMALNRINDYTSREDIVNYNSRECCCYRDE